MNRQEFCVQIVKSLENVWNENILFDFAVKVQDETIQCHRLILAACSEFFKVCFRSEMKESTDNVVVLKDVSREVFRVILKCIYSGKCFLTLENFIDVWRAAHMLQIDLMIHVCEQFAIEVISVYTWENIYEHANLFGSENVLKQLHTFMIQHFEQIRNSETFLKLTFEEVKDLIESQDLVVNKEDSVLEYVIKWIKYEPKQINFSEAFSNDYYLRTRNNHLKNEIVLGNVDENLVITQEVSLDTFKSARNNTSVILKSVIKSIKYPPNVLLNIYKWLNSYRDFLISNKEMKTQAGVLSDIKNTFEEEVGSVNISTEVGVFKPDSKDVSSVLTHQSNSSSKDVSSVLTHQSNSSRKEKLTELMQLVRTCLVSRFKLYRLLKIDLFSENEDARNLIIIAMAYQTNDCRHGQWPSASIHRSCSEYVNAGIAARSTGTFGVITACNEEKFNITVSKILPEKIQLINFDGELYAAVKQRNQPNGPCQMFVLCDNSWKKVLVMPTHNVLLASRGHYIYIINKDDHVIHSMDPKRRKPYLETFVDYPAYLNVKHGMFLDNFLVLFCTDYSSLKPITAIHTFDILSKVWTRLDNLDGPPEHLITFRNDKHNYILQNNGNIWLMLLSPQSGKLEFTFLAQLWDYTKKLHGALTFQTKLIIFGNHPGNDPPNRLTVSELPGHFKEISHWGNKFCCSNFVPILIAKKALRPTR